MQHPHHLLYRVTKMSPKCLDICVILFFGGIVFSMIANCIADKAFPSSSTDINNNHNNNNNNGAAYTTQHPLPNRSLMEKAHDLFYSMMYNSEIPGAPGKDYPIYANIPKSKFRCAEQGNFGYYADVEAGCQVIHICQADGSVESFLCPNGTIFNQQYFVCDWWFNVDCNQAPSFYELNGGFGKVSERNYYQEPTEKVTEKDYFQESKVVEVKH